MPDRKGTATGISEDLCRRLPVGVGRYIRSLEADRDRMNVLEEMRKANRLQLILVEDETDHVWVESDRWDTESTGFPSFREAADAELRRRNAR